MRGTFEENLSYHSLTVIPSSGRVQDSGAQPYSQAILDAKAPDNRTRTAVIPCILINSNFYLHRRLFVDPESIRTLILHNYLKTEQFAPA